MRNAIFAVISSLALVGCSQSPTPLDSGTPISGTIWKYSLRAAVNSNEGTSIPRDAKVYVYADKILIRNSDGSRQVVPLDYVSDLKFK